jgi:membrane protein YdbS with pleckstrin-like domain
MITDSNLLPLLALAVLWVLPWKGVALWKAARLSHKWWFIVLLVVNTFAILEIFYIFIIASKYKVEATEEEVSPAESEGADSISDSLDKK